MGCGSAKATETGGQANASKNTGETLLQTKCANPEGFTRGQLIIDNKGQIKDFYEIDKRKVGEGSYGSVSKAQNKSTGQTRAVKTLAKACMKNVKRAQQEIAIMKMMDHPNIIKLHESFEDHNSIYLVMELCSGGELFDRIIDAGHFTEVQAAILMQQIVRATYYMHQHHVAHRDLKPENFLFVTKDPIEKNSLKLIDFGLSCSFSAGQVLKSKCGTAYYVSPQVLQGKYDHMCDMWSIGVLMYIMLCGYPPFFGDTDADVMAKVRLGCFSFHAADWKNISDDAKKLIRKLLRMNPTDRYTAEETLNHEWIRKRAPLAKQVTLSVSFVDKLRGFRSHNKLKKAALAIIAQQLNDEKIKQLRDTFISFDANGDGLLTEVELREGLAKAGLKDVPPDLQQILQGVDSDGSGVIDYTEFLAATLDKRAYLQQELCWAAFLLFDKNGDGKISKEELNEVLQSGDADDAAARSMADLVAEVDQNSDGEIDFEEFMHMMRGSTQ
jgi:calcium-dependent protein kinase